MSKIMRELAAEGRAARESVRSTPQTSDALPVPEFLKTAAACTHGILKTDRCFACGRWGDVMLSGAAIMLPDHEWWVFTRMPQFQRTYAASKVIAGEVYDWCTPINEDVPEAQAVQYCHKLATVAFEWVAAKVKP